MIIKIPVVSWILSKFDLSLCRISEVFKHLAEIKANEKRVAMELSKHQANLELVKKERDAYKLALTRIAEEKAYNPVSEARVSLSSQPKYY